MGRKLSLVPPAEQRQGPAYVVANADESEPGAFKDREIVRRVPHRFLEGCLIAAHAIQAEGVFIYVRGEYLAEALVLEAAIEEARRAGLFGEVKVPGPTSAERSPPCSSPSRAAAASRDHDRPSRRSPAFTCSPP
jgi:NADH:ubiquinone oxidoreductase subunit F (NADH-binding)